MYSFTKDHYSKILLQNIAEAYRIAEDGVYQDINEDLSRAAP